MGNSSSRTAPHAPGRCSLFLFVSVTMLALPITQIDTTAMLSAGVVLPTRNCLCGTKTASLLPKDYTRRGLLRRKRSATVTMSASPINPMDLQVQDIPILVNGCSGKMGKAVIKAALSSGLHLIPLSFGLTEKAGKIIEVCGKEIKVYGPSERESVLASVFCEHPNMIVVDYTLPNAVNSNAELYCNVGVPFVMGTTGGDRDRLYKTVEDSNVYAVIAPQMGKQVVAFLAAIEIMAERFPGAFSGYSLEVRESHQSSKLDTSGTATAMISFFKKLGVSFDIDQIQAFRDPEQQMKMMGVPEEYLSGHAFHLYRLSSPDGTVNFEFKHEVCDRSIYAEGTVDAVLFLAKKIQQKADQRIYNMLDVLREGSIR